MSTVLDGSSHHDGQSLTSAVSRPGPEERDPSDLLRVIEHGLDRLESGLDVAQADARDEALLTSLALSVDELLSQLTSQIDGEAARVAVDRTSLTDGLARASARFEMCRTRLTGQEPSPRPGEQDPGLDAGMQTGPGKKPARALVGSIITGIGAVMVSFVLFQLVVTPAIVGRSQLELSGAFKDRLTVAAAIASSGGSSGTFGEPLDLTAETPPVPKLAGETEQNAVQRLQDEGYSVRVTSEASTDLIPGLVVRTDPLAGTPVDKGATITVVTATQAPGVPVAGLNIPALGENWIVVEGTGAAQMATGPGHFRDSPLPGQKGNAVIAGHRTIYGAPFRHLDNVQPDDQLIITTLAGVFDYRVRELRVIRPGEPDILGRSDKNLLTLVTANPPYTAIDRLAVIAELQGKPVAPVDTLAKQQTIPLSDDEFGRTRDSTAWAPALLWGELFVATIVLIPILYLRWSRWPAWLITTPILLALGCLFFESVSRLLPSTI